MRNARGPRLLIPSGLLGVTLTTMVVLALNGRRPAEARIILLATVAVVIVDGWIAFRAVRRIDAEVATPTLVTAGSTFSAQVAVHHVRRPVTVDPLFAGAPPTHFDGPEPFLLECHPAYRGVFNHLLIEIRCRSPLGLWAAARRIAVVLDGPLWVAPAPQAGPAAAPPPASANDTEGDPGSRAGRGDEHVRGTRDYVTGDSARLVHWPATAHHGRLMVRETEGGRGPIPTVVVEAPEPGPAAEHAFGQAAAAARDALREAGSVRLVTAVRDRDGAEAPIPRSVLVPAAPLRLSPVALDDVATLDRVESSVDGVGRRLAEAVTGRVHAPDVPTGARWFGREQP